MNEPIQYAHIHLSAVDREFESEVLKLIPDKLFRWKKRNHILRYGSSIPYSDNVVSEDIPQVFQDFIKKMEWDCDSVTVNEYQPGQFIDWHVDSAKGGHVIKVVSLLSDATIRFRKRLLDEFDLQLPRFSLLLIGEELRWDYYHSLRADERRISVVFRNSKEIKP